MAEVPEQHCMCVKRSTAMQNASPEEIDPSQDFDHLSANVPKGVINGTPPLDSVAITASTNLNPFARFSRCPCILPYFIYICTLPFMQAIQGGLLYVSMFRDEAKSGWSGTSKCLGDRLMGGGVCAPAN